MQFTLTELQVLAGLADGLTVVDIGQRLSLGHSAVSRAVHVAQQRAGVQLVELDGRRLRLTLAGRDLAVRASAAIREIEDVGRLADGQRAGTSGVVRILSSTTPADYLLPDVIAAFLAELPDVGILLRTAVAEEAIDSFDLRIGPPEPLPAGWRGELLYTDELVFFVSAHNALASARQVTWDDLLERPLVGSFLDPIWPRYWVGRQLDEIPRLPRRTIDVSTPAAIRRIVEATDAVGVAVRSSMREQLDSGQFVQLRTLGEPVDLPYVLAHRVGVRLLPTVARFRELLLEHVAHRPSV